MRYDATRTRLRHIIEYEKAEPQDQHIAHVAMHLAREDSLKQSTLVDAFVVALDHACGSEVKADAQLWYIARDLKEKYPESYARLKEMFS
jgi:hypothetical protein